MNSNKPILVRAPAKLNLFLHVIDKRKNGYHSIESVFVPIDWYDIIYINNTQDNLITRDGDFVSEVNDDLLFKAANIFKKYTRITSGNNKINADGCSIYLKKNIPSGAGLGGGSSNAAKTLLALNKMWNVNLPLKELIQIGKELGADVPFFLQDQSCFVSGIGEKIDHLPEKEFLPNYFVVLVPKIKVSTRHIFESFTTNNFSTSLNFSSLEPLQIKLLFNNNTPGSWTYGRNDIEDTTVKKYPIVKHALDSLRNYTKEYDIPETSCRMSGTGGSVFCSVQSLNIAKKIATKIIKNNNEKILVKVCKRTIF